MNREAVITITNILLKSDSGEMRGKVQQPILLSCLEANEGLDKICRHGKEQTQPQYCAIALLSYEATWAELIQVLWPRTLADPAPFHDLDA